MRSIQWRQHRLIPYDVHLGAESRVPIVCSAAGDQPMALLDYRKLCSRSGHVLTREERDALGSAVARRAPTIRCESCGRDVELVVNPTTGRSYVYPMHVKACASTCADPTAVRQGDTP